MASTCCVLPTDILPLLATHISSPTTKPHPRLLKPHHLHGLLQITLHIQYTLRTSAQIWSVWSFLNAQVIVCNWFFFFHNCFSISSISSFLCGHCCFCYSGAAPDWTLNLHTISTKEKQDSRYHHTQKHAHTKTDIIFDTCLVWGYFLVVICYRVIFDMNLLWWYFWCMFLVIFVLRLL